MVHEGATRLLIASHLSTIFKLKVTILFYFFEKLLDYKGHDTRQVVKKLVKFFLDQYAHTWRNLPNLCVRVLKKQNAVNQKCRRCSLRSKTKYIYHVDFLWVFSSAHKSLSL